MYPTRAAILSFGLLLGLNACVNTSPVSLGIGQQAPAFEANTLEGKRLRFPEDTADKVVLIRFWAEQCRHCEGEMKALESTYQQYKDKGFVILAINAGQSQSKAEAFARKLGLSFSVLLDEDNQLGKRYGIKGVPTSYMVDAKGTIRSQFIGQTPPSAFEESLLSVLAPATP
ncbi:MAG: TlpA family protein disulfide reductase [Cystobacterineae bacterium]|nr:TlpA family protein disulfide reductase [Cystobacterineae bacterium]